LLEAISVSSGSYGNGSLASKTLHASQPKLSFIDTFFSVYPSLCAFFLDVMESYQTLRLLSIHGENRPFLQATVDSIKIDDAVAIITFA